MQLKALCKPARGRTLTKTLLIMNITAIFLLSACLTASAAGYSQITLSETNAPMQKVLREIQKQSGYDFLCTYELLEKAGNLSVKVNNVSIQAAVEACLKGKGLTFEIQEKTVVIKLAPAPLLRPEVNLPVPPADIHGRVGNESGEPMAGATVTLTNGKLRRNIVTNSAGEFIINDLPDGKYLAEISFIGYETFRRELVIKAKTLELNVIMKRAQSGLDEMQVIAYGSTTKRLSIGNVSTVKAEDIAKQPVSNPLAALEGRVPGLIVNQATGLPGGDYSTEIHGQSFIFAGGDPLIVIDGTPIEGWPFGGSAVLSYGNMLNYVNPQEIESIDVLKDADATAIYGSRGANGVILITTKRGKAGNMHANVNAFTGWGNINTKMKLMNSQQFIAMRREAFANDAAVPGSSDMDLNGIWDSTSYTDWKKAMVGNNSGYSEIQASISGGTQATQYSIGGNYHKETTVFPSNFGNTKGSAHFSINSASANNKFRVQLSGSYMSDNDNLPYFDLMSFIFNSPVSPPSYNKDGTLNWTNNWQNPYGNLATTYMRKSTNFYGNAELSYRIVKGLLFKVPLGYSSFNSTNTQTIPSISKPPPATPGSADFSQGYMNGWNIEPQLTYDRWTDFGKFDVLAGFTLRENASLSTVQSGYAYSNDALLNSISGAQTVTAYDTYLLYKYSAVFGRISYNLSDRYLLNVSARRDASSNFGPGNQVADFWSAGGAWIFSGEKPVRSALPFLSFGKLRVSYGTTGIDQIGYYQFLDLYRATQNTYQGATGYYPAGVGNPNLAWGLTKKLETGLDLGFFKDRILLNANFYLNRSSNQLIVYPLPSITGFQGVYTNFDATVENRGYELTLNTENIKGGNFTWKTSINLTLPSNKLLSFPGLAVSSYANQYVVGKPITINKVLHKADVDPQTGVYRFTDNKGNLTFTPNTLTDATSIVDFAPRYYGGFQNSFEYQGFSLDFLFQFVNKTARNSLFFYSAPGSSATMNQPVNVLDRWQKPGDIKPFEKFSQNIGGAALQAYSYVAGSDAAYSDASFIRLKNVSLAWQLPARWMKKWQMQSCSIYMHAQNLLTFSKYKGFDPENVSLQVLPPLRVITFGAQISL